MSLLAHLTLQPPQFMLLPPWASPYDNWLIARQLRNKMVHEYIEDPTILAEAVNGAHHFMPLLLEFAKALTTALTERKLI